MVTWNRRARWSPRRWVLVAACILVALGVPPTAEGAARAADSVEERIAAGQEEFEKGLEALDAGRYRRAIRHLEKADGLAPNGSILSRLAMARCRERQEKYDEQVEAARSAVEIAGTAEHRVEAYTLLAEGLKNRSETWRGVNEEDLVAAAEAYGRASTVAEGRARRARLLFERGVLLLQVGRDQEGISALLEYLRLVPRGGNSRVARSFIERPARAREPILPDLVLETLDGQELTDEALDGKVVVLDFWATWCGPCHASLPTLQDLHALGEESGLLTIVSISQEPPETVLPFAQANGMDWTLARNADGFASQAVFGVRGLPTIIVADHEGRIVHRVRGWSSGNAAGLTAEAERAVRKARKQAGGTG